MNHAYPVTSAETMSAEAGSPAQKQQTKMGLWLLGGSAGCALLLCLGLFIAGGMILLLWPFDDTPLTNEGHLNDKSTSTVEDRETPQDSSAPDALNTAPPDTGNLAATDTPEIGPLAFALEVTDEGEPVEAGATFTEGIAQIHAVFAYANIPPDATWTHVWYHNGAEVLRSSQPWLEADAGVFDYVVEAGGEPLPAGPWTLEFYIEGELLTSGSFVIDGKDETLTTANSLAFPDTPKVYKLVYPKWNGEKHDLYVGDTNGSQEQFILSRAAGPSWSPDGRYIFFYGEEGVDQQVVNGAVYPLPGVTNGIARLNASPLPANISQIQLFQGHGWNDGTARWANVSPDGTMIAYDGDRGGGRRIYFLGSNANHQFRYEIIGEQADWSPDSQKIVYRSGRNNQTGLWISRRNDTGHTRLTTGGTDSFPSWSADGRTIAFSRGVGGNVDIYTINLDGSDLKRLTDTPGHDTLPAYLPNGDIVFRTARAGRWEIWKMRGDGSDQTLIIPNAPVGPDWAFCKMGVLR